MRIRQSSLEFAPAQRKQRVTPSRSTPGGFNKLRIISKALLPLLLIVCAFASSALAHSLFVVARLSDAVAVIDDSTDQIITRIPVGNGPVRITMSPDRLKAYVSNGTAATVSVLDTVALTTTATIQLGSKSRPQESAVTPDGGRLFVIHQLSPTVTVIDTATNQVITNVFIGGHQAKDILFTLDGRFAYVANYSQGTVNVIDTATYQVTTIPTGAGPRRLAISPSGDRVFVTNNKASSVSVIDTATREVITTLVTGDGSFFSAINPDATRFYVSNSNDTTVSVIDIPSLTVLEVIPDVGSYPFDMAFGTSPSERTF